MNLLLDTQIAIWAVTGDRRLGKVASDALNSNEARAYISIASLWEIAIKYSLGRKLHDPMPFSSREARQLFKDARYELLPVTAEHTHGVEQLPRLHGDPFDRMLVSQALTEPMRLLTRDPLLKEYGALVIIV